MDLLSQLRLTVLILISLAGNGIPFRIPDNLQVPQNSFLRNLQRQQGNQLDPGSLRTEAELLVNAVVPSYVKEWVRGHYDKLQDGNITLPVNDLCADHLRMLINELEAISADPAKIFDANPWALQMIDSWGKFPEGILSGHINTYGDFDECVNLEPDTSTFKGKYCWTYLLPTGVGLVGNGSQAKAASGSVPDFINELLNPTAVILLPSFATCAPSSCSTEDVQALLTFLFTDTQNPGTNAFVPGVYFCTELEKPPLSSGTIAMISVLGVLGVLILAGTVLDTVLCLRSGTQELRKNIGVQVILAFSLVTNVLKWQNTKSSEGGFGCIHGIRFLSTCWVLLCHTIVLLTMQPPSWNGIEINKIHKSNWSIYVILNGYFSVDTFFTMSGLLACFSILKALDKSGGSINIPKLYIHRYLRLTPTYALLLGLLATVYPYLGDGPFFSTYAESASKACQDVWWHNLLYVNNLVKYDAAAGEAMCEGESWYIANDMQFFILSPLFVYLLWKWQYVGIGVLGAASIASILTPAISVGTEKLAPTLIFWKIGDREMNLYQQPWHRIGPYLVGIWMGYLLFKLGKRPVKLPKLAVVVGWTLSTVTAGALIFGISPYYYPDNDDNAAWAGIYAGLSRFTWGIVICWIIFACVKGYGGVVNSFLSWKAFIPLGRLTFCVYVSSFSIQMLTHMTIRQPMYFDMYTAVNLFFSHVIMCFLVGFGLTMAFESPFIQLEKILLGGGGGGNKDVKQTEAKTSQDSNANILPSTKVDDST